MSKPDSSKKIYPEQQKFHDEVLQELELEQERGKE